jgi:hypothetical protein
MGAQLGGGGRHFGNHAAAQRRLRRALECKGISAVMDQRGGRPRRKRFKAQKIRELWRLKREVPGLPDRDSSTGGRSCGAGPAVRFKAGVLAGVAGKESGATALGKPSIPTFRPPAGLPPAQALPDALVERLDQAPQSCWRPREGDQLRGGLNAEKGGSTTDPNARLKTRNTGPVLRAS